MRCFVLGSGSWGTTLALIAARKGIEVVQWCRRPERARELAEGRHALLPGVELGDAIQPLLTEDGPAGDFDFAISAVPTQHLRHVLEQNAAVVPRDIPWVSATKGLEIGRCKLPSQILQELGVCNDVGILTGPSHAEEAVREVPTAVVIGHGDADVGRRLQEALSSATFRVYYNDDPVGCEWGGVLKNVIALASGIAIGYGFGDNTLAALVTRGAVEMARLGVALGGRRDTFNGLSGIGDLMVTCFSEHSRNRTFGIRIGQGEDPRSALEGMVQVVEGVPTSQAVVEMCRSLDVEMPIAEEVHLIVHEGKNVGDGVEALLSRSLKQE